MRDGSKVTKLIIAIFFSYFQWTLNLQGHFFTTINNEERHVHHRGETKKRGVSGILVPVAPSGNSRSRYCNNKKYYRKIKMDVCKMTDRKVSFKLKLFIISFYCMFV